MNINKLFDEAQRRFSLEPEQEFDTGIEKKRQMVSCQLLMEEMESRGALQEEKENLLLYMSVLVNAEKKKKNKA